MKISIQKISHFDPVTKFRLQNAFMVGIGLSLLAPVLVVLKGTLLPIWVISMLGIITTLAIYTNEKLSKLRLDTIYKLGIGVHLFLIFSTLIYFWNPTIMIILVSISGIIEAAVFSAYAINLNEYITRYYPRTMKDFQIRRNTSYADATLIGLAVATVMGLCCPVSWAVMLFVVYNTLFSVWMIQNWNFYLNPSLKGFKEISRTK